MFKEIVCHEFPAIGKYRVRLVRADLKSPVKLDIREYVKGHSFEGFTRRGIQLQDTPSIVSLYENLGAVVRMLEVKK